MIFKYFVSVLGFLIRYLIDSSKLVTLEPVSSILEYRQQFDVVFGVRPQMTTIKNRLQFCAG